MDLLLNTRRGLRSGISAVRVDEGVLTGDGPLPTRGDPGSRTFEAVRSDEGESAYCRQCDSRVPLAATRTLSTHSTSGGLVTYFRCEKGHADFYVDRAHDSAGEAAESCVS